LNIFFPASATSILAVAISIIALSTALIVYSIYKLSRLNRLGHVRPVQSLKNDKVSDQVKTDAVLANLDIGIVAYGNDGRYLLSNKAMEEILGVSSLPTDLNSFMTSYCEENGVMARLLLGKSEASGVLKQGKRVVRITAKESRLENKRKVATIFILQDITHQELQEEKRKEFVANVSHELKTPLTTIITYTESLIDWGLAEKTPEGIRNDVKRMHDDALRMQGLVTDLLLLSSIDSNALRVRMEQLDLSYVMKQAVERLQIQAEEKDITLSCTSVSIVPPIFGDRASIDRIISNLVSNSIKYSGRGSEVKVYIGVVHDEAYVKVNDNGFGMDQKHLDKIFDRFYRVDGTGSRAFGGTGLGLSIVKELVDMHGGQIVVQSGIATGSLFTIMFPLARTLYNKTIDSVENQVPIKTPLAISVANDLKRLANEGGVIFDDWKELDEAQLEKIKLMINDSLADDEEIIFTSSFEMD
jgi:two-component system sensor histidine kinase VicK